MVYLPSKLAARVLKTWIEDFVDEDTGEITENIADNFYIEVELEGRDFDEEMIKTIKKQTAFSKVKNLKQLYTKNDETKEIEVNFDFFQSLDEVESRNEIEVIEVYQNGTQKKTDWKKPEPLIQFLKNASKIKLFFCKSLNGARIFGGSF